MKKLLYIILAFTVVSAISCKKNLDLIPLNNITVSSFFKTESDFKGFVDGLYQYMVPGQNTPYLDIPTDLFLGHGNEAYIQFSLGNYDATSADVALFWNYAPIRSAYIFFEHINE